MIEFRQLTIPGVIIALLVGDAIGALVGTMNLTITAVNGCGR